MSFRHGHRRLSVQQIRRSAGDGLLQAVHDGWRLRDGDTWEDKVLLLRRLNNLGWYDVVNVVPADDL